MGFENCVSRVYYDIGHRIAILTFRKPNGLTRKRKVTLTLDSDTGHCRYVSWLLVNKIEVKVKVKVTLVQALRLCTGRTAHRGSRGIALLYRH
jgi:hypothetical protein